MKTMKIGNYKDHEREAIKWKIQQFVGDVEKK